MHHDSGTIRQAVRCAIVALSLALVLTTLDPSLAQANDRMAEFQLRRAIEQLEAGNYSHALRACRRAYGLRSDPKYILWLARIHARANQMSQAKAMVRRYHQLRRKQELQARRAARAIRPRTEGDRKPVAKEAKHMRRPRLRDIIYLKEDLEKAQAQRRRRMRQGQHLSRSY
jgi:tetratricopeptide (TPR) repeat protein